MNYIGIVLSFRKRRWQRQSRNVLPWCSACSGPAGVHSNESLPSSGSAGLDAGGWCRGGGDDTGSYCALQRSLRGAAEIYFSTAWFIDSWFLLGFISGASLPSSLFLRSWLSDALDAAVSFSDVLAMTQWCFSLVSVPADNFFFPLLAFVLSFGLFLCLSVWKELEHGWTQLKSDLPLKWPILSAVFKKDSPINNTYDDLLRISTFQVCVRTRTRCGALLKAKLTANSKQQMT